MPRPYNKKKFLYHVEKEYWDLAVTGMVEAKAALMLVDDPDPGSNSENRNGSGIDMEGGGDDEDEEGDRGAEGQEYHLQLRNNIDSRLGRNIGRRGARSNPNTSKTYETTVRGLRWWCCLIGDYESLLVLQDKVPRHCPSMNPRTLELFARFKTLMPGQVLTIVNDKGKEKPFLDVLDREIKGKAASETSRDLQKPAWAGPQSHDTFCAAVKKIHEKNIRQVGQFQDRCEDCWKMPLEQRFRGCVQHPGNPRVRRLGDPTTSVEMTGSKKQNQSDHADHSPDGAQPLLPSDLVRLRAYWCSRNSLEELQAWVIFLVSCRLFLRANEATGHHTDSKGNIILISGIQLTDNPDTDSINWTCTNIKDHVVVRLGLNIKGKSDKGKTQTLTLLPDDSCPLLCPVRHLLVYVYLAKIKKGHLFPTLEELDDPPTDGVFKTYLSYETYKCRLSAACTSLFNGREGHYGTHTARKTGYLLALWAGGELELIKYSARHSTDSKSAQHYYRDASALCDISKENGNEFILAKWKPILIVSQSLAGALQRRHISRNPHTLYQVAKDFMELKCNVNPKFSDFSITYCLQSAMAFRPEEVGIEKVTRELMTITGIESDDPKLARLVSVIQDYAKNQVTQAAEHFAKQQLPSPVRKEKRKRKAPPTRPAADTTIVGEGSSGQMMVCMGGLGWCLISITTTR